MSPKILFLAANIQPFLLAGVKALIEMYDARVLIICWPISSNSPTAFYQHPNISYLIKNKNEPEIYQKIQYFNADIVWGAGWMDSHYLKWAKMSKKAGKPVVMAMDTQWRGTIKQYINFLCAPFFLKKIYSHVWAPGPMQYKYANKLGYSGDKLLKGLYTVDTNLFANYYHAVLPQKQAFYPKQLLYVGRLIPHKIENLLIAFSSLSENERNGWGLMLVGNGDTIYKSKFENAHIIFKDFMHQNDFFDVISQSGIFCLTSTKEPWGMVIQEFAAAGLPLLISSQCGAKYSFLADGKNGYLCDGTNPADIRRQLKKMIDLSPLELFDMGKYSHQIATITHPEMWAVELMKVYRN